MKTVIGLFWQDGDVRDSLRRLEDAGFSHDRITTSRHIARKRLVGDLGHPIVRYSAWGAIISIAIFGTFGLGAAFAGCNCFGYDSTYSVATLVGFVLVGGLVGALLGLWIGIDALERDTHLYVQGLNLGGKLVIVQADDEHITKAMDILRDGHGVGVTALAG